MSNAEEIAAAFGKVDDLLWHLLLPYRRPVLMMPPLTASTWKPQTMTWPSWCSGGRDREIGRP